MGRYVLALTGLVVLTVCARAADEQWLMYRTSSEMSRIVGMSSRSIVVPTATEAPDDVALPELNHKEPVYGKWSTPMTETGHVWFAFDRKGKYGSFNRLYADLDCDGDLTDEEAIKPRTASDYSVAFGPIPVVFTTEEGPVTYHLSVQLYTHGKTPRVYLRSSAWYEGKVTVGDNEFRCILVDYNTNGRFGDAGPKLNAVDRVRLGPVAIDKLDTYFVGELMELGGAYYRTTVATDGAFIAFEAAEDIATGTVQLSSAVSTFSAAGAKGLFHFQPDESGTITLPAGKYKSYDWSLEQKDDKGIPWKAHANTGREWFVVREGAETELSVGAPLVSSLKVTQTDGQFRFSQSLQGQLKESVSLTRKGSRPPAPKLRLVSKTGDYDKTLTFEYG
ncbi:MAG: hypothetical protein HN742_07080 [Lentisphaerae bacterium]|jgi:hypothetical protein|nr:hypothetical protein [Lentisphaerota bacterium]MBT4814655.1 hypothetical protein [Lentisphaerota bacterium]MBT5608646.1 hypothetical protein [Lentisphaerota bacterium]MBT7057937.1 hypothetical protein [Lentisphaerota bacterium]MBT7841616.1 hypothetical protein [Lentisphaerota bacterium]